MGLTRACIVPRCPHPAIQRGRCHVHKQTTAQRGYGRIHRLQRALGLPTASCAQCGCRRLLQLDHIIPVSLGGTDDEANKRWLCACPEHRCHAVFGVTRARTHRLRLR